MHRINRVLGDDVMLGADTEGLETRTSSEKEALNECM